MFDHDEEDGLGSERVESLVSLFYRFHFLVDLIHRIICVPADDFWGGIELDDIVSPYSEDLLEEIANLKGLFIVYFFEIDGDLICNTKYGSPDVIENLVDPDDPCWHEDIGYLVFYDPGNIDTPCSKSFRIARVVFAKW